MRSILVASGDPSLKKRIHRLITANLPECSMRHAADGDEVFRALDDCPDIILLDSKLHGHHGFRFINAIKAVTTEIPIVQILENDLQESRKTAIQFGADYLVVGDEDMEARLSDLLRRSP